MPTLRQLEYLTAIASERHFRRAAERAGVSQPTLSAQLTALEERLGVQLVERDRSGVLLTPVGRRIEGIARGVLRDVQEIRDLAAGQRGEFAGMFRLGLPPTVGPYLLPRLLPKLHRDHPDLQLYVREEVPRSLPRTLQEGGHDVVIVPVPVHSSDLHSVAVFREPLYLVVPTDHPFAKDRQVERRKLRGQSILTLESGHQLREQVEAICDEFGARLLRDFEGTSLDTLRQMVGMGLGLSFLPGLFVHTALRRDPTVSVVELKGRSLYRTIGIAWRKTSAREREFQLFADKVRDAVKRGFPGFPLV